MMKYDNLPNLPRIIMICPDTSDTWLTSFWGYPIKVSHDYSIPRKTHYRRP